MELSIRARLIGIVSFSVIGLTVVGLQGIFGMHAIKGGIEKNHREEFTQALLIMDANDATTALGRDTLNYAVTDDAFKKALFERAISRESDILSQRLRTLTESSGLTEREQELLLLVRNEFQLAVPLLNGLVHPQRGDLPQESIRILQNELAPIIERMGIRMDEFLKQQKEQSAALQNAAANLYRRMLQRIVAVTAIVLAVSIAVALLMARSMVRSLRSLVEGAEKIAMGDFHHRVQVNSGGEIRRLAAAFTSMAMECERAQGALEKARDNLEILVQQRTQELERTNEELEREVVERKRAEQSLVENATKLKLFAYSIVHDLKSPAVGLHGITGLLEKHYSGLLDERGRVYCRQIEKTSEQILLFVEKINTFISSKESPLSIETIDFKEILCQIREEFSAVLAQRQVEWHEPEQFPPIRADRQAMVRVFRNIVDNALKYGGAELSRIQIDYEKSDSIHLLSVADNGAGIDPGECDKVFRLFHTTASSMGVSGAGLGLSIVKEIAEKHGGKAWMEPGQGTGAIFRLSIARDL